MNTSNKGAVPPTLRGSVPCDQCGRQFTPKFSYQQVTREGRTAYFCSQLCRDPALGGARVPCSVCGVEFTPTLALHVAEMEGGVKHFCSDECRRALREEAVAEPTRPARVIAVLNQKGGTAKTTTAVSVAAGLARAGCRTLLVDLDPQGNVSVSLGLSSARTSYHLLASDTPARTCITWARDNLDVVVADEGLAAAEIVLARDTSDERTFRLANRMAEVSGYEYVVLDCAPALSVLNHNALAYADEVLIPVSCDYLALVGVKQVLRTLRRVGEQTGKNVKVAGVLPTFFDVRNRVCAEVLGYLRKSFGSRALPPVRVNTRLAEAPSHKKTIFEHAPDSHGARDYIRVVEWLRTGEGAKPMNRAA